MATADRKGIKNEEKEIIMTTHEEFKVFISEMLNGYNLLLDKIDSFEINYGFEDSDYTLTSEQLNDKVINYYKFLLGEFIKKKEQKKEKLLFIRTLFINNNFQSPYDYQKIDLPEDFFEISDGTHTVIISGNVISPFIDCFAHMKLYHYLDSNWENNKSKSANSKISFEELFPNKSDIELTLSASRTLGIIDENNTWSYGTKKNAITAIINILKIRKKIITEWEGEIIKDLQLARIFAAKFNTTYGERTIGDYPKYLPVLQNELKVLIPD